MRFALFVEAFFLGGWHKHELDYIKDSKRNAKVFDDYNTRIELGTFTRRGSKMPETVFQTVGQKTFAQLIRVTSPWDIGGFPIADISVTTYSDYHP